MQTLSPQVNLCRGHLAQTSCNRWPRLLRCQTQRNPASVIRRRVHVVWLTDGKSFSDSLSPQCCSRLNLTAAMVLRWSGIPFYTPISMLHACIRCRYHSPLPLHAPLSPARPLFPLPSRPPIQTPSLCTLPHKLIVHIDIYDPLSSPSAHYTHRLFIPFPCLGTPPPSPSPLSPPWAWPSVATHHGHVSGAVTRYSHGSAAHVTTPLGSVL